MAISSSQVNQLMAGQQAMFGNNASYAQQISPMGQAMGMAPSYSAPMGAPGASDFNVGTSAAPGMLNAAASFGQPVMMGAGMMMGGRAGAMLDPFTAGARAFGASTGWQGGAGLATNLGNVARSGAGGIARGVGMAGMAAAAPFAAFTMASHAVGQMAEGAQFYNQVDADLQRNFRFTNDQSRTGYGFGQGERKQIVSMMSQMGSKDMMTTPQELRAIMNQGTQMGMFRGVQDAKEFKQKFMQMKDNLKEIAQTFNTTLGEALPFLQQARQQGFWTPQDITKHTTQVRQVQANTGMSAAQAQSTLGMGAQMSRSIGGTGQQGAGMMARAQMLSGSALFGGVVGDRELGDAGFGTGAEGAQNLGSMLAGATARFARSRTGRWALASLMNKEGTGLDPAGLKRLASGGMGIGEIGSRARGNVSGERAYKFVGNEGELRGQLAEQGPEAALGIVRSLAGGRLYGESGKDKLVTRRLIQRFMGGNARQADIVAKMARDMPRMMEIQSARSEGSLDAQARQREEQMHNTYEGFKRQIGSWWEKHIDGPMKELGSSFSYTVGKVWQRATDRIFGTTGRGIGLSSEAVRGMVRAAETGDMSRITDVMGGQGLVEQVLGGGFGGDQGKASMFRASRGVIGESEAGAIGFGSAGEMGRAMRGQGAQQIQAFMKSGEALGIRGRMGADMSTSESDEFAGNILTRIQAGRAGSQAQAMFQNLGKDQAIARLRAMQGQGRGGFMGLGVSESEAGFRGGQDIRTAIENNMEEVTESLADEINTVSRSGLTVHYGGGLAGVSVGEKGIEELKKDPRGDRAMRLFARANQMEASGEGSPEQVAAARKKARGLMAEVGGSRSGVSKEARSAAIKLADETDPLADSLAKKAGKLGTNMMASDRVAFDQKISRRRDRLRETLGGEGMTAMESIAGEGSDLAKAFSAASSTPGEGMISPTQHTNQLLALARAAAEDPERAAGMLSEMESRGAGTSGMATVIRRAMSAKREAKRFGIGADIGEGEAITDKARQGISKRLGELGIKGIGKGGIAGAIRGEDTAAIRSQLKARGWSDDAINREIESMKGGITRDEMLENNISGSAASGLKTLSEKVAKRAGLADGTLDDRLTGRSGSKAMVEQLESQTALLGLIEKGIGALARGEKLPPKPKNQSGVT